MSYLNQTQDSRRRAAAIAATIAVHAALGIGVVTGLTIAGYKPLDTFRPTIEFPTAPPPPDPTPPPPTPDDPVVSLPQAPDPLIVLQPPPPGPVYEEFDPTEVAIADVPRVLPDPGPTFTPRPSPGFTPKRAVPRNDTSSWISTDDYPRQPLTNGVEGSVGYRVVIGTNGRVASCELTRPSGNRALDDTTCRLIASRARFEAATDETGAKVLGTYAGTVTWEIPD